MGFDPKIRSETFGGSDKSWIRVRDGLDTMLPSMLDMSQFSASHLINGRIPSGTALALIKDTSGGGVVGFYGPYSPAIAGVNEVQRIAVDATGGTFTITFRGTATAAIAFNAAPAAVQAALELNPEINHGDVVVSGGPGAAGGATPYILTFSGQYAGTDVAAVTTNPASLTGGAGTAAVTTATAGAAEGTSGLDILAGHLFEDVAAGHYPDVPPDPTTAPDVGFALYWEGVVNLSKLPNFAASTGKVDAAGIAQVAAHIRYV